MAKTDTFPKRVRDRWFNTSSVGTKVFGESLTKQEFKDECDVNIILSRYNDSPPRPWTNAPTLRYGDFAEAPDFLAAQLLVKEAEALYNSMPAPLRDRLGHDPARFLDFVHDPANREECRKLGLLRPDAPLPPAPPAPPEPTK